MRKAQKPRRLGISSASSRTKKSRQACASQVTCVFGGLSETVTVHVKTQTQNCRLLRHRAPTTSV
jgi:hypothetical protein